MQRPGNFGQWFVGALVLHHRGTRSHAEGSDLGKIRGQLLGYPVGEKLLVFVPGEVLKRQHGQRLYASEAAPQTIAQAGDVELDHARQEHKRS